ncbi:Crp/Fnr family transcriptional regulator [Chitinimonas sp. BJYL2]|uniref:Crp/Fnr family transcriptional regulator n=1 Tax=Chitinimonas sp. BJYL2 TaxID=2976696 RepID=UPI0022B3AB29|nr:Crp/Fnr family transcriptional regulator [Chitinimonas sp. BJYL2]
MSAVQNHLIARLPRIDRQHLLAVCEPVELLLAQSLYTPSQPTRHVYFPINSFVSLVALVDQHPGLEVGMVGSEGMLGSQLGLGIGAAPLAALVQGAGSALRVKASAFRLELARSTALLRCLHRYLYVVMSQQATSAACLHFHLIGPRLARWLLMSQDRAHSDQFDITQAFLGYMLGVRRVTITMAAGELQRSGLIAYRRGKITVLDRAGLEAVACSCYAADRRLYARLMH